MARQIRFKNPGDSLVIGSQKFTSENVTPVVYDALVDIDPDYANHFEVYDDEIVATPAPTKKGAKVEA